MSKYSVCIINLQGKDGAELDAAIGNSSSILVVNSIREIPSEISQNTDIPLILLYFDNLSLKDFDEFIKNYSNHSVGIMGDEPTIQLDRVDYIPLRHLHEKGIEYTAKKLTQKKKERSEKIEKSEFIHHILKDMADAVVLFGSEGQVIASNTAAQTIFGRYLKHPFNNLPGDPIVWYDQDGSTIIDPAELPIKQALEGIAITNQRFCIAYGDGRPISWQSVTCKPHDIDPKHKGCILVANDFTHDKAQEFQLQIQLEQNRVQRQQLQIILETIEDGIVCCDVDGSILFINERAKTILGKDAEQIFLNTEYLGKREVYLEDSITPLGINNLPLLRALKGEFVDGEIYFLKGQSGKDKWIKVRSKPIKNGSQATGALLAVQDITTEKLDAIEREFLVEYLQNTNDTLKKVDDRRQKLLRVLAHDLRNPLCSMDLVVGLLKEDFKGNKDVEESTSMIEKGIASLITLVDEVVEEALTIQSKLEYTQVTEIVDRAKENTRLQLRTKNIHLLSDVQKHLPKVHINKTMAILILENLITNAIKFSSNDEVIEIKASIDVPYIKISVKDYGLGIPQHLVDKIFTGDKEIRREGTSGEKSTGVGLSFVWEVLNKMNGTIECRSKEGEFTEFIVYLPIDNQNLKTA